MTENIPPHVGMSYSMMEASIKAERRQYKWLWMNERLKSETQSINKAISDKEINEKSMHTTAATNNYS